MSHRGPQPHRLTLPSLGALGEGVIHGGPRGSTDFDSHPPERLYYPVLASRDVIRLRYKEVGWVFIQVVNG